LPLTFEIFLADWRRVNVAFTRPRSGLVVLGHPDTLARDHETWGRWLQWVSAHGVNVRDPVPRGQLDRAALHAAAPSRKILPPMTSELADYSGAGAALHTPALNGGGYVQTPAFKGAAFNGGGYPPAGAGAIGVYGAAHANGYAGNNVATNYSNATPTPGAGASAGGGTMASLMGGDWEALMNSTSSSAGPQATAAAGAHVQQVQHAGSSSAQVVAAAAAAAAAAIQVCMCVCGSYGSSSMLVVSVRI
jgi:hypothetical protein